MQKKMLPFMAIILSLYLASCAQKKGHTDSDREPSSETKDYRPWTTWYLHEDKAVEEIKKDEDPNLIKKATNKVKQLKARVAGLKDLSKMRTNLIENSLHDPHASYKSYEKNGAVDCSKTKTMYRSADGTCTDLSSPYVGAAGTAFGRNVHPDFIDHDAADKLMEPNPGDVSKAFFTREETMKEVPFLNMLAASWIQFMNHDWVTHGKNLESNPLKISRGNGQESVVERTKVSPVKSSDIKGEFGKVTVNDITHWWDGSQIYGSSFEDQKKVRSFKLGQMLTVNVGGKELLPRDGSLDIARNKQNFGHEITGFRDNWWVGLSMLHHLFVKEHNEIAKMLYKEYVKKDEKKGYYYWDQNGWIGKGLNLIKKNDKGVHEFKTEAELDEHIFQVARLINAAVMAKIHTVEWTPAILPNPGLILAMCANWYGTLNPNCWSNHLKNFPGLDKTDILGSALELDYIAGGIVGQERKDFGFPYNMTEEFTSVYRLHSLLPEKLNFKRLSSKTSVTPVDFLETRNEKSYALMEKYDLKDLFYSFGTQKPGQLVLNNFPKFMQELPIPGHGIMDLSMVDIIRDRERGVPRYNQFRRGIGLKPIRKYSDFFPGGVAADEKQKAILKKFETIYGKDDDGNDNVEAIDLLVGTLGEEVRPTYFGFGETQFQIFILMASRRLMTDRFYTENYTPEYYTKAGLAWIDKKGVMADVIGRHMPDLKPFMDGIKPMNGLKTAFNPWKE
jgi:hypothetical protein